MQRTIEVWHEGYHQPTPAQIKAALGVVLLDEDLKIVGDPEFVMVENTSGGPSKVRATFEGTERTKTVGVKKAADPKPKADDSQ